MEKIKLKVRDLEMEYDGKRALDKVSFNVQDGEFLSILGPSGCGKTTILRILIGLLKPTGGTVTKDGIDITDISPAGRGMGIVFQNYALFENMTVLENVEYALKIRKENKANEARQAVREKALALIQQMDLTEHIDKKPAMLSGGQQQRVAIARTLIMNPDIIMFDEPMSALDVATRLSLRKEIKRIQAEFKTTMIYITHDQEEAFAMSDRIMVMKEARLVQIDTPENIISNPADDYVKDFVLSNLQAKIDSLLKYVRA
ncbi:ABC transporter ATP-binding protein [Cloacibacillus evryensis]|uniref:ABC transporter ATP-binding protein n=1 Tax=Cloacibacillus evryensis TaxID=508460 RepID=UPI0004ADD73D|nr:ABC transporter ATP-binding protein [Cloacibacillus evryensis]MEA5035713.1 ABC transporter ATP-binding protein [Cloacibacillus evryensis]